MGSADTLQIMLHPKQGFSAEGRRVKATRPFDARLRLEPGTVEVDIAIPPVSRAEARWGADKVIRKVRGTLATGKVAIDAAEGVDHETLLAIALDLHHATRGRVRIPGNHPIEDRLALFGAAEDGFRAWVNEDPATRTSVQIAQDVGEWAESQPNVEVTVLEEAELREKGLNLLLAVGQASEVSPPRLVIAQYTPKKGGRTADALMLLGKGITFDTGGINVKPYASHVSQMKNDMAGAALAWWAFRSAVEQRVSRPLLLVIPTCENAIGEKAMRPGSVVKSYRGPKVRIDHTDAEGRLALADGLAYAIDTWSPQEVMSFATLTTAALIAYGPYATPVHFAGDDWKRRIGAAADAMGEDVHFFPYRMWHFEANRDREADLRNTARLPGSAHRSAGSRNAAHFLQHFTNGTDLVHLDIFASTWNWAGDAPGSGYGATGAPLRTVLAALLEEG